LGIRRRHKAIFCAWQGKICCHTFKDGPADNQAGIKVDYHCQVEPAFVCLKVCDIANLLLVLSGSVEILLQQLG
jgi:hypothetical protein